MKNFSAALTALSLVLLGTAAVADDARVDFPIDCMVHDTQGALLSDLGMVGAMMDGTYKDADVFKYQDLRISVSLNAAMNPAPEVAAPRIEVIATNANAAVVAQLIASANPDANVALYVPGKNVFIHCTKMEM